MTRQHEASEVAKVLSPSDPAYTQLPVPQQAQGCHPLSEYRDPILLVLGGWHPGRAQLQVAKLCILAPQSCAHTPLVSPGVGAHRDILIIFLSTNGLLTL